MQEQINALVTGLGECYSVAVNTAKVLRQDAKQREKMWNQKAKMARGTVEMSKFADSVEDNVVAFTLV